jgi:hypothetical protein
MTRHTIAKIFASESDGSNLAAGAAWQRNTRVDIPSRMPRAAGHRVNQKAPSVAILALFYSSGSSGGKIEDASRRDFSARQTLRTGAGHPVQCLTLR